MNLKRTLYSQHIQHEGLLRLLLTHDGSTTRLCSAVNHQDMAVYLHQQYTVVNMENNPIGLELAMILGGNHWLQRITSLHNADHEVFMDNLSFTRLDAVPTWFVNALNEGKMPIGRLLDLLFIQRKPVKTGEALQNILWNTVGLIDDRASRSYTIATTEYTFMLIFEVFRDALRFKIT